MRELLQPSGKHLPELFLTEYIFSIRSRVIKRAFDLVISLFLIILTLPIQIILLIIIPLTSSGPPIYRQLRYGKDLKPFYIYKYRSMIKEAELKTGPVLSHIQDDRVTRLGKFIRATRLDELPQLINVIRGDMSIVGPRPERPFFVNQYEKKNSLYYQRMLVKPGITGYAQVKGSYYTPAAEKLFYDLTYIKEYSLWFDIKILYFTLLIVITKDAESSKQVKSKPTNSPSKFI
ncbi:sugar transferase [Bacillaceae bacterium W0354]